MRPQVASIVQPIAQFLAAFPANLFFGFVVSAIVLLKLTPDIWLSPLMILGTQWYILFNVIVGASAISPELRYAGQNLGLQGLAVVAASRAAGGLPVLRDGGHHGGGRLVERQHRLRGRKLGARDGDGPRTGRVHSRGHRCGGLPARGAGDGDPEPLRRDAEPALLAPAVRARGAQVPPELRT